MKFIVPFFTGLIVAGNLLQAQETKLLDQDFLSILRSEAVKKSNAAIASEYKVAAANDEQRAIRLWNDPQLRLGFMAADKMMRADNGDMFIAVEQALPKPGMLAAQRNKAAATARAESQKSLSSSLVAGADAARAAIEVALADESITLQELQISWLSKMAENAKQKAADPSGSSADALRMQSELAKEVAILDAARRSRDSYAQKLNIALGRPLEHHWSMMKLPTAPPPVPIAAAEIARISHKNPSVRAMAEIASAAHAETVIADRERLPNIAIVVEAQGYSGGNLRSTSVGLGMSLPWFNESSYQAKIDAAKNRERAATNDIETMRREIAAMILTSVTAAANAASQAHAYSGEIHEKAFQASQATEAAWISSKASLTDLLDSSRSLFAIRLEQRRLIAMQLAALEDLEIIIPNN